MRLATIIASTLLAASASAQCTDLDFNNDGVYPSDQDTIDFQNVLAGADCPTCDTIDFNGDGVFPDDADYTDWLAVLAGGPCSNGGFTPVVCAGCVERVVGTAAYPTLSDAIRATRDGGIITIPFGVLREAVNWPGLDGLAYSGSPSRPFIVRGQPGPNGERPTLELPDLITNDRGQQIRLGSGMRVAGGVRHIQLRGLRLVGGAHESIIAVQGSASNILVEDCELVGGTIGISVQGMGSTVGTLNFRRNIIHGQKSWNGRAQCMYLSGDSDTTIEQNVFNATLDLSNESQGIYSVYGNKRNRIARNWFFNIFGAGAQMRGGQFVFEWNAMRNLGTFAGAGHPMAWSHGIWTDAAISHNYLSQSNPLSAAQWGLPSGLCAPCIYTENVFERVSRPWMPFSQQMGQTTNGVDINTIPDGQIVKVGNIFRETPLDVDWAQIERTQMTRPAGAWGEQYETRGVIERSKR